MPKTWTNSRRDIRDLSSRIRKGTVVYTVAKLANNLAPYEDSHLYSAHVFDWKSPVTGHWMTGHLSVSGLLAQCGTVYEQPPHGMRGTHERAPQVAPPLGTNDYYAPLDEVELSGLDKRVRDGSNPSHRSSLRGRRG
ncbi:MAG: hypothetical protein LBV60_23825 [Streptomyces sp.]|jgi:hypothetical protein|nr:hypothetical protein [Streptomyces sp.]